MPQPSGKLHSHVPTQVLLRTPTDEPCLLAELWTTRRFSEPQAATGAERKDTFVSNVDADPGVLQDKVQHIIAHNFIGLEPEGNYFPDDEYESTFNRDAIAGALGGSIVSSEVVDYVKASALKTFATLLIVFPTCQNRLDAITAFERNSFTDIHDLESDALELCPCSLDEIYCGHQFPRKRPWTAANFESFRRTRWQFLVPKLETSVFKYEFDAKRLLPFVRKVGGPISGGVWSEVTPVEMLSKKQDRLPEHGDKLVVALKTLRHNDAPDYNVENEWNREAKAHQQLNNKSPHLIRAIAAYKQIARDPNNNKYHLVLEWADGGNLLDFWKKNQEAQIDHLDVKGSQQRVCKTLEQLLGLLGALNGMHSTGPSGSSSGSEASSPQTSPQVSGLPDIHIEVVEDSEPTAATLPPQDSTGLGVINGPSRRYTSMGMDNWRHGDIKPENILRFKSASDPILGTLKLADLGRARQHILATQIRRSTEHERIRTHWYEPPDLMEDNHALAGSKISRLFDVWSVGCVIFETVLWLLYGYTSHQAFYDDNKLPSDTDDTCYWKRNKDGYAVSNTLLLWIEHILTKDPECNGVLGELLLLVRDQMLKIALPPDTDVYTLGCRANAQRLHDQLAGIITKAKEPGNAASLFSGSDRSKVCLPLTAVGTSIDKDKGYQHSPSLTLRSPSTKGGSLYPSQPTLIARQREYTVRMENKWVPSRNTDFAEAFTRDQRFDMPQELCVECDKINLKQPQLSFKTAIVLQNAAGDDCDLCTLLHKSMKNIKVCRTEGVKKVNYFDSGRDDIVLECVGHRNYVCKIDGVDTKVLRLCLARRDEQSDPDIPVGVPSLLTQDSNINAGTQLDYFARLPNAWLDQCDTYHGATCCPARPEDKIFPKRLVNIENPKRPKIVDTAVEGLAISTKYVALSHKWGDMPKNAVTTSDNIEGRIKRILLQELPPSFQHAIAMTKALRCNYLWIDSLCIMQGDDGDFAEEADKMETTFSGAHCVLAACSAMGAGGGFLVPRETPYVNIGNLCISAVTDDFERDVLRSELNKRGWVLQERALARRTIFFTDTQMYWECGHSIQTETLAAMINDTVAFLGDANFPDYTIRASRTVGEQLVLYINLVELYSRLEFSHNEDRPIAIDGLMQRLTKAYRTRCLAGVFESYWGRCLLWRRADNETALVKIPPGLHSRKMPPSWSWMAYRGRITYITPPGKSVLWNDRDIVVPFRSGTQASWLRSSAQSDDIGMRVARAYEFEVPSGTMDSEAELFFDDGLAASCSPARCVIVGREQALAHEPGLQMHYVLIVRERASGGSFERIGVAQMLGSFIRPAASAIKIRIE